jgi:hypothetical protein
MNHNHCSRHTCEHRKKEPPQRCPTRQFRTRQGDEFKEFSLHPKESVEEFQWKMTTVLALPNIFHKALCSGLTDNSQFLLDLCLKDHLLDPFSRSKTCRRSSSLSQGQEQHGRISSEYECKWALPMCFRSFFPGKQMRHETRSKCQRLAASGISQSSTP